MSTKSSLLSRGVASYPLTYNKRSLPTDFATCQLWLSASSITGLSDGNTVATWPDLSPNGYDYTQSTEASKPTYQTNELGGHPIVRFDNSDDGMTGSAALSSKPCTVVALYKYNSDNSGARRVVQGASVNWLMGPYSNQIISFVDGSLRSPIAESAYTMGWNLHCTVQPNSVSLSIYTLPFRDGQFWSKKVTVSSSTYAPATLALGASGAYAEYADCDVAEVAAFSEALTDVQIYAIYHAFRFRYYGS